MENGNHEDLINRAVEGETSATAQLLAQHGPQLLKRLENRLRLNAFADFSAEDVLQETFVDVFRGIKTYDTSKGTPFAAWLTRVADNRLAMFLRTRSRVKRGGKSWRVHAADSSLIRLLNDIDDSSARSAGSDCANEEAKQAVDLCVASLPENQQEAIQRYYLDEESLEMVASAMGITKEAVRGLIHRAKKSMRTMMGNSSMWFMKKE